MHSSGSVTRIRPASWMQSTGQTSTHDLSLMSMQGSAVMYVTAGLLYRRLMVNRQSNAGADGGLYTAHCARLARHQGPPALAPVEPATLLGTDPPRDDANYRSTISSGSISSRVRSKSADFATTWSNPAAWARRSPAV